MVRILVAGVIQHIMAIMAGGIEGREIFAGDEIASDPFVGSVIIVDQPGPDVFYVVTLSVMNGFIEPIISI
jgi:hypothetical protein